MGTDKTLTIIAAMGSNRAIGRAGRMPWHLPAELRHFKAATLGKPVVMGRKTWESIGRPLPGRQNIVVTRDRSYVAAGCECAASLADAIERAAGPEVMIIGGGELYRLALPLAGRMLLTLVDCAPDADTWFPEWAPSEWRQVGCRRYPADDANPHDFEVRELRRNGASAPRPGTGTGPPRARR